MLTPSQQPCKWNWGTKELARIIPALAGVFALLTVVLGFIGLVGGQGVSPLALVSLLISLALLALFLLLRQRDAAKK